MEKDILGNNSGFINPEPAPQEDNSNNQDIFDSLFNTVDELQNSPSLDDNPKITMTMNYEDFDDLNIGIIIVNSFGIINYVNKEIYRLGEISGMQIAGMDLLTMYKQMDVRDYYTNEEPIYDLEKVLTTGTNRYSNIKALNKITTPYGKVRIVQSMMLPIKDGDGFGFVMIINDLADRENSVAQIDKDDNLFKILSLLPISILIIEAETTEIFACNDAFTALTSYKADEIKGIRLENFKLWSNDIEKYRYLEVLFDEDDIINVRNNLKTKDDKEINCELFTTSINYNNKKFLIIYIVDITNIVDNEYKKIKLLNDLEDKVVEKNIEIEEMNTYLQEQISTRKNSENKLEVSIEKYSSLIEQLPVGVYRINNNGEFIECNSAFLDITGHTSIEDVNSSFNINQIKDSIDFINGKKDLKNNYHIEFRYIKSDNVEVWVNNVYKQSKDEDGDNMIDGWSAI